MAQVASFGPFYECDLTDQLRLHPATLLHLINGKRLSPPRGFLFRKVAEWAIRPYELFELRKNLIPLQTHEAVFHLCDEDKLVVFIDADQQSIEAMRTGDVTADDKLLLGIGAELNPCSSALACLVNGTITFANDPL
jgi:hypothetical protein